MKKISFVLLALGLAACKQPGNETLNAVDNEVNATAAANGVNEDAAAPTSNGTTLPTSIPAQFRGRWGINRADCTSTRGDAKGLLIIEDAGLTFFESRGTLGKVLGTTGTSFDARYDFTGEGQQWQRTERLSLVNGKLQRRTDEEAGQEPPVNLTYERCPS
jgi:hypothetical protein